MLQAGRREAERHNRLIRAGPPATRKSLASGRSAEPFGTFFFPARLAIAQGIVARMGGDCLTGSRRHDQSPVPALPGCAMVIFTLDEGDVFGELGGPRTHEDLGIFTAQQI